MHIDETNIVPWKWMIGIRISFRDGLYSRAFAVSFREWSIFWAHFEIATKPQTKTPLDSLRSSGNQLGVAGYLFGPNCWDQLGYSIPKLIPGRVLNKGEMIQPIFNLVMKFTENQFDPVLLKVISWRTEDSQTAHLNDQLISVSGIFVKLFMVTKLIDKLPSWTYHQEMAVFSKDSRIGDSSIMGWRICSSWPETK